MPVINRRNALSAGITLPASAFAGSILDDQQVETDSSFQFCVLGDTCYDVERDYPTYMSLINEINKNKPAFTIHVGDTKGAGLCDEELQRRVYRDFDRFDHPLFYTPGDNEWVDAYLDVNGNGNPLDSLLLIREIFFSEAKSLGKVKAPLIRQADVTEHKHMVENAMWNKDNVLFATVHIPGTNNGYSIDGRRKSPEFEDRNKANLAWVRSVFATAKAGNAPAVVIAFHADWYREIDYNPNAFEEIDSLLREESVKYNRPVLLLHGDYHIFTIDRPYHRKGRGGSWGTGYNVTRLQPHGAPELKAVMVTVDPSALEPFSYRTISVPQIHRKT